MLLVKTLVGIALIILKMILSDESTHSTRETNETNALSFNLANFARCKVILETSVGFINFILLFTIDSLGYAIFSTFFNLALYASLNITFNNLGS